MRHYHWIWFSSSSVTVSSESISWICLIHSETNWIEQWYDILYFHLPSASAPILIILSTRIFGVQSESKKDSFDFYLKNYVPPFISTFIFPFSKVFVVVPLSCSTFKSFFPTQIIQILTCNIFFVPCTPLGSAGSAWPT